LVIALAPCDTTLGVLSHPVSGVMVSVALIPFPMLEEFAHEAPIVSLTASLSAVLSPSATVSA
jgi:hypothetical protein